MHSSIIIRFTYNVKHLKQIFYKQHCKYYLQPLNLALVYNYVLEKNTVYNIILLTKKTF